MFSLCLVEIPQDPEALVAVSFRAPSASWWNYRNPQDEGGNDCHIRDGAEKSKDWKTLMKVSL